MIVKLNRRKNQLQTGRKETVQAMQWTHPSVKIPELNEKKRHALTRTHQLTRSKPAGLTGSL